MYKVKLFNYLLKLTKSKENSEELLQEVFCKIWISRDVLNSVENPEHYLYIVARNKVIDFIRKAAVDKKMREHVFRSISHYQNSTEEGIDAHESEKLIQDALIRLSPQKQTVFRLSRSQGLSHQQIAVQLNISKNTVKNHLVEALKLIKAYLSQHSDITFFFIFFLQSI